MHSTLSPRPKPLSLNQKPLCATVGLAIESDNVVGYTIGTTGSDNNFVTVPFALVGFNTSDIQQIKLDDGGIGSIGWGTETFSVWEGVPTVATGSEFVYWDASMNPAGAEAGYFGSSCMTVGGFPPHKFAWPLFYGLLSRSSGPRNFD